MSDLRPEFWLQLFAYVTLPVGAYFALRQTVAVLSSQFVSLKEKLEERLDALDSKVDDKTAELEASLKEETKGQNIKIDKLGDLFVQSARYEERLAHANQHIITLRTELNELKHWQGFVGSGARPSAPEVS